MYFEDFDNAGAQERNGDDVFSKPVRAGKRTYFFDVRANRNGDHYMIITESRRKTEADGSFTYEKNKIFLYPEDMSAFSEALSKASKFISDNANSETDSIE